MKRFESMLKGGDLRSIGQSNKIVSQISSQKQFDELFQNFYHSDRKVVMRTADAVEKITIRNHDYLQHHKQEILQLIEKAKYIELKWHLALIISRLNLNKKEFGIVWQNLSNFARDKNESKIVRVNSVQGLFNLLEQNGELTKVFNKMLVEIERENIPSLNARIRKIKNAGT